MISLFFLSVCYCFILFYFDSCMSSVAYHSFYIYLLNSLNSIQTSVKKVRKFQTKKKNNNRSENICLKKHSFSSTRVMAELEYLSRKETEKSYVRNAAMSFQFTIVSRTVARRNSSGCSTYCRRNCLNFYQI